MLSAAEVVGDQFIMLVLLLCLLIFDSENGGVQHRKLSASTRMLIGKTQTMQHSYFYPLTTLTAKTDSGKSTALVATNSC